MHRIPGVQLPETLQLASVTSPASGDDDSPYVLHIIPAPRVTCPNCRSSVKPRVGKTMTIADLPIGDHPVLLEVATATARCRTCGEEVACALPDAQLTASRKATSDLARYLLRQRGKVPLRTLAARTGLSHHAVRALQQETADPEGEMPEQVDFLGLDEIFILKSKYLVAVDYSARPQLLKLMRAANARTGRTGQSIPPEFFEGLPDAHVIALDMNSEQMKAVRKRWPKATVVIDRRHMIEALNRDLLRLVEQLIKARFGDFPNDYFAKQATRTFGTEAYAYQTLRALVLRRRDNLTPADQARWLLLRRENPRAELLYEGYMWREALHELYDARMPKETLKVGLTRWTERFLAWRKRHRNRTNEADFMRSAGFVTSKYAPEIINYAEHPTTNAQTERVNALIRQHVRQGRRYDPQTVLALVNAQPTLQQSPSEQLPALRWYQRAELPPRIIAEAPPQPTNPVDPTWLPLPGQNTSLSPDELATLIRPEPWPQEEEEQATPEPVIDETVTITAPEETQPQVVEPAKPAPNLKPNKLVRPRGIPAQPPEFALPERVWYWLHSKVERKPLSPRWLTNVLEHAPPKDLPAWGLLCAGQLVNEQELRVTAEQLELWRATVLMLFAQSAPDELSASERIRQPKLAGLPLTFIRREAPQIFAEAVLGWVGLTTRFASLDAQGKAVMSLLEGYNQLAHDPEMQEKVLAYRTELGGDRNIWDPWRIVALEARAGGIEIAQVVPYLERMSPTEMNALMQDPEIRWGTYIEWLIAKGRDLPPDVQESDLPVKRLGWFLRLLDVIGEQRQGADS